MKRTCVRCGKSEFVRRKNASEYCIRCQKSLGCKKYREKKIKEHRCMNCGKATDVAKCPHCKEIIKYYFRCNKCRKEDASKTKLKLIELEGGAD